MFDIEGPRFASEATFVLGARPVTGGYDNNIGSQLSSAVFFASRAPSSFSSCVLACLESIEATATGTLVTTVNFDESNRQLTLNGPVSPYEIQTVLRSLVYTNRAPDINTASIRVEVCRTLYYSTVTLILLRGVANGRIVLVTFYSCT